MLTRIQFAIREVIAGLSFVLLFGQAVDATEPVAELTLRQVVSMALEQNPDLMAIRERIGSRRGELTTARTYPFNPQLVGNMARDGAFANEGEDRQGIALAQELQIGGQRGLRVEVAEKRLRSTVQVVQDVERQVIREVKRVFHEVIFLRERLAFAREVIELNRNVLGVAQDRARLGDAPELEANLARVELQKALRDVILLETDLGNATKRLNSLLGRSPDEALSVVGRLQSQRTQYQAASLVEFALAQRPDLSAVRLEKEAAESSLNLARRERIPNITASFGFERERSRFTETPVGTIQDADKFLTFKLSIPLPLINRKQGEIETAGAEKNAAERRRSALELAVRREVAVNLARVTSLQSALDFLEKEIIPQVQDNFDRIRKAYQLKQLDIFRFLTEQERFIRTRQEYLATLHDYTQALVDLESVVGGGGPVSVN